MIRLEPVTESTFNKVLDMKLGEEQNRFVAPNIVSIAQAWLYYDNARPFAVLDGDEAVGFLMLDWQEDDRTVGIWRFMIAPEHQRKGYGRAAMEAALTLIRESGKFDIVKLDYVKGNTAARELYYSLGFRENGEVDDGEIVMALPLTDSPRLCMFVADQDDADDFAELAKEEGAPSWLADADALGRAIDEGRVRRFTIMGDTVGLALDGELYMQGAGGEYAEGARAMLDAEK